jgi:hypothetical protein
MPIAEDLNIGTELSVEPGTVMVLGEEGALFPASLPTTNAWSWFPVRATTSPALFSRARTACGNRLPCWAVHVKANAHNGATEVGDLLTTSSLPGQVMKAVDQAKAFARWSEVASSPKVKTDPHSPPCSNAPR